MQKDLRALKDKDLDRIAGGIKADYVGDAKRSRCKASNGQWTHYCNRPNWADVGTSYVNNRGDKLKQMICLNCGAQAHFKLCDNGQWALPNDWGTED